jgi:Trypsin-like peptidase domain
MDGGALMPTSAFSGAPNTQLNLLTAAVVQVGNGRGFIVGTDRARYVITAAHCLPRSRYPSPHLANSVNELTFPRIIGPLGSKGTIWAELCALSLTDDLAVFTEPDGQELCSQNDEYEQFTETAITVGEPPPIVPPYEWDSEAGAPARVLSLDCSWLPRTVYSNGRFLTTRGTKIESGMSGSPILNSDGDAIGLISTSGGYEMSYWHPSLMGCLPRWLSMLIPMVQPAT